jgi:hypothetical protein
LKLSLGSKRFLLHGAIQPLTVDQTKMRSFKRQTFVHLIFFASAERPDQNFGSEIRKPRRLDPELNSHINTVFNADMNTEHLCET